MILTDILEIKNGPGLKNHPIDYTFIYDGTFDDISSFRCDEKIIQNILATKIISMIRSFNPADTSWKKLKPIVCNIDINGTSDTEAHLYSFSFTVNFKFKKLIKQLKTYTRDYFTRNQAFIATLNEYIEESNTGTKRWSDIEPMIHKIAEPFVNQFFTDIRLDHDNPLWNGAFLNQQFRVNEKTQAQQRLIGTMRLYYETLDSYNVVTLNVLSGSQLKNIREAVEESFFNSLMSNDNLFDWVMESVVSVVAEIL